MNMDYVIMIIICMREYTLYYIYFCTKKNIYIYKAF